MSASPSHSSRASRPLKNAAAAKNGATTTNAAAASKIRLRLWLKILKTSKIVEAELRERLRTGFETTLPRFDVMAALDRADKGLKMNQLSGVLKVSNGNVTGIVDRLVNDGHAVRIPVAGDRRATVVQLTAEGQQAFSTWADAHEAWVDELLGTIDTPQAQDLIELLSGIAPTDNTSEQPEP